ncbi:MAG: type II toxin-antitoxin system RelE/ParE family toxin [Bacteroidetes bacterium]|nr:type II toxin-antitoxin system RelE/ParE family toxin [Bacteroidota bacterium]
MVEKTYEINVWKRAQSGIKKIYDHVYKESPQNAVMVRDKLYDVIDSLETFPYRFSVFKPVDDGNGFVRSVAVWDFIIVYRIREEKSQIAVTRVFHGARNK